MARNAFRTDFAKNFTNCGATIGPDGPHFLAVVTDGDHLGSNGYQVDDCGEQTEDERQDNPEGLVAVGGLEVSRLARCGVDDAEQGKHHQRDDHKQHDDERRRSQSFHRSRFQPSRGPRCDVNGSLLPRQGLIWAWPFNVGSPPPRSATKGLPGEAPSRHDETHHPPNPEHDERAQFESAAGLLRERACMDCARGSSGR